MDSGATVNFIRHDIFLALCKPLQPNKISVQMLNNCVATSVGSVECSVAFGDLVLPNLCFYVMDKLCCEAILGAEVLRRNPSLWDRGFAALGSVVNKKPEISLINEDYSVYFMDGKWTLRWKWSNSNQPEYLKNNTTEYGIPNIARQRYESEIERWITQGILQDLDFDEKEIKGIIPLFSVIQPNKDKVRPVMDFRELNSFLSTHTADADVCSEKLRHWRSKFSDNIAILDLKDAFLQIHVDDDLQKFQVVKFKGKFYKMTRLCFGMSIGPKVMSDVVNAVLKKRFPTGVDSYIDDILVDQEIVAAETVRGHLNTFGLCSKNPEFVDDPDGMRVLGLRIFRKNGAVEWRRDNAIDTPDFSKLTKRQLFSVVGKLIGHYPVCGWLRVSCSYIKRFAIGDWDEKVTQDVIQMLLEIFARLKNDDPVRGLWSAQGMQCDLFVDASSLAIGAVLSINSQVVEDCSWLRPVDDPTHINVSELNAVVKGINLALRWGCTRIRLHTDSSTCKAWLDAQISGSKKVKTKGMAEMLVRRRLSLIGELIEEYGLHILVDLVPSQKNISDPLTRVPKPWFRTCPQIAAPAHLTSEISQLHDICHPGIKRTLHLCKAKGLNVTKNLVRDVVKNCEQCQSIDPAPVRFNHGTSKTSNSWERLSVDYTKFANFTFLTMLDCHSGFTIWRKVGSESADALCAEMNTIFLEWGPPAELLTDNGPSFISDKFNGFLTSWGVSHISACAYRPQGNPVERIHRTVKAMASRSGKSPLQVVFWVNRLPDHTGLTPLEKLGKSWSVFLPNVTQSVSKEKLFDPVQMVLSPGDKVFVKPSNAKCISKWNLGTVTKLLSDNKVEVDGMPRHITHLRKMPVYHYQDSTDDVNLIINNSNPNEADNIVHFDDDFEHFEPNEEDLLDNNLQNQNEADGPRRSGRKITPLERLDL